ncbi:hypothetical protein LZK76_31460 (plasmid) [Rhizobium leguminosarum]|nr:hypothetical protein LZK76_31460 [Rhizobium leguminosarum]
MTLMVKDLNGALDLGTQTASTLPLTATARGLMQSVIGLFGEDARLDDVIAFTEKLSSVRLADELHDNRQAHETPVSTGNLDELLARAVAACNVVAVLEAVEVGRKFRARSGGYSARD